MVELRKLCWCQSIVVKNESVARIDETAVQSEGKDSHQNGSCSLVSFETTVMSEGKDSRLDEPCRSASFETAVKSERKDSQLNKPRSSASVETASPGDAKAVLFEREEISQDEPHY